jgi:hypothetical protein
MHPTFQLTDVLSRASSKPIDRFRSRTRTSKTTWKWRGISIHGHNTPFSRRLDVRVLDLNLSNVWKRSRFAFVFSYIVFSCLDIPVKHSLSLFIYYIMNTHTQDYNKNNTDHTNYNLLNQFTDIRPLNLNSNKLLYFFDVA